MIGDVIVTPEQGIELKKMGYPQPVVAKEGQFYVFEEHVGNGVFVLTKEKLSGLFKASMLQGNVVDPPFDFKAQVAYLPSAAELLLALDRMGFNVRTTAYGYAIAFSVRLTDDKDVFLSTKGSLSDAAFFAYRDAVPRQEKQNGSQEAEAKND